MKKQFKNILEEVQHIVYERTSEKQREYGDFDDSMRIAADIMGDITKQRIPTKEFYTAMISLKLSRLSHAFKHDTYLDLLAYITAMYEHELLMSGEDNPYEKKNEVVCAHSKKELGEWLEEFLNELNEDEDEF